ncbi:MAG TPA: hypothetical protein VLR29_09620 [Flavobacterium sp.]|nr:hypothetical protein [Flavobacterium sp.]
MGTLIKRKGSFPLMAKKTVSKFFDDFITQDFDWSEKKFSSSGIKPSNVNLQETDNGIADALPTAEMKKEIVKVGSGQDLQLKGSENEAKKKENPIRKEFNYRSFCRLPD